MFVTLVMRFAAGAEPVMARRLATGVMLLYPVDYFP
jgi:hypothetical protein